MIEALRLRTRGDSLSNISVRLGVSKSTLQGWFNRLDQAGLNYEKAKSMTPSQLEDALALIRRPTSKDFSTGVCNFSCPGQVYRWGGAIRPSSFLRLGNPQSGQKGRSLSAIARVVKHSWNCARPKASADRPEQMPRKVLAQPERLPIACGLGDAKRSACSPPSHAAASAGVTGAEPLSRGWQSVQAFHLG